MRSLELYIILINDKLIINIYLQQYLSTLLQAYKNIMISLVASVSELCNHVAHVSFQQWRIQGGGGGGLPPPPPEMLKV